MVMATVALFAVCGVCLAVLAWTLVPPHGGVPWLQDPGDPGPVVARGGADVLAGRIISATVDTLQDLSVIRWIALGCALFVWASFAAVDVLSSRGERGWWWRALAGAGALALLGSVVATVHASMIVTITASGVVTVASACLPGALRALTHSSRGRAPSP